MSYVVENINGCTKKLKFNFTNVDLTKQIAEALSAKQKEANLKGFRKGKAPISMVQKLFGPQIENDALYRFLSQEFFKAIQTENIKAIGYPNFANTKFENAQKTVEFEAIVETFPEIAVKDFSSYSFSKGDEKVTNEDIDELTKKYLASKSVMTEITDATHKLTKGQFAVINFEGEKANGDKPENMKASEFLLEIGSNQFIPGFEEGLIGCKKGEKKTLELTFPKDYHEEDLKNAKVKFHVEVLEIKEKRFPELTDEIAKEFGFENVADFNDKNKKRLTNQKKREVATKLHQEILEKLVAENKFDIPATLINQQKEGVKKDLGSNLKAQGFDDQMIKLYFEKWDSDVTQKAEFQVRSGLILDNLAKKYSIEATDADLGKKFDEMTEQSGIDKKQLESYYLGNSNLKNNLMYAIREEKTFDKIISLMKVK
jgi:trigger factor